MMQKKQEQSREKAHSWREQLNLYIRTIEERKHIARQLGVNPLTVLRWANSESSPHRRSLQKLLALLPDCEEELIKLSNGNIHTEQISEVDITVALSLYTKVLRTYSSTPPALLFWSVSQLILQQALIQLASEQDAVEIVVAQCMPPSHNEKIRSLREVIGGNNICSNSTFEYRHSFLGVESLAGAVLATPHKKVVQNFAEDRYFYPRMLSIGEERSCVACPILHANRVAGILMVASTTQDYFSTQKQLLIEQYTELFALAFDDKQFYPFESIELYPMPSISEQRKYITTFRQRVRQLIKDTEFLQPLTVLEAEQQVWQQIEQELLQVALVDDEIA